MKKLWFHHFSQLISLLVLCCSFSSFILTEDLTGLLQILSPDWLNFVARQFFDTHITWVRKSVETMFLLFESNFISANWLGRKLKLQALGSFPYSSYTQATILSTKASRENSAKFKRRAEWADSYKRKSEKKELCEEIFCQNHCELVDMFLLLNFTRS